MASISIDHPTDRPNHSVVSIGMVEVAFSYSTPVAFHSGYEGWTVSENLWGPTTGKHLNAYGRKEDRVSRDEFEKRLSAALATITVGV